MKPIRARQPALRRLPAPAGAPRRGVAALLVLLMVAMALAMSYATIRAGSSSLSIQRNGSLAIQARNAAATGLELALGQMKTASWQGVGVNYERSLGNGTRFSVSFSSGDESLAESDPDYAEWPYRVTVVSSGYATAPGSVPTTASYTCRAVVRLVPERLSSAIAGWDDVTRHTVCQWRQGDFTLTVPARIEGPVRIRGALELSKQQLNWSDEMRRQYLGELNPGTEFYPADFRLVVPAALSPGGLPLVVAAWLVPEGAAVTATTAVVRLRLGTNVYTLPAGASGKLKRIYASVGSQVPVNGELAQIITSLSVSQPDRRPLIGPLYLDPTVQDAETNYLLGLLNVPVNTASRAASGAPPVLSSDFRYRLYPGGKQYVAARLSDATEPTDPKTNPLRIFVASSGYLHRGRARIEGTLITTSGSFDISEGSLELRPLEIPPATLSSTLRTRLPVLISADDLVVRADAKLHATGQLLVADDFEVRVDDQNADIFTLSGGLAARDFYFRRRWQWPDWSLLWQWAYADYLAQKNDDWGTRYFRQYLADAGLSPDPKILLAPAASAAPAHWQDFSQPLFQRNEQGRLEWETLKRTDRQSLF